MTFTALLGAFDALGVAGLVVVAVRQEREIRRLRAVVVLTELLLEERQAGSPGLE